MAEAQDSVAVLHGRWQGGDRAAGNLLYSAAFPRLRLIAAALMRLERPSHTLQPTALVNESFLKFHGSEMRIADDEHLFHLSARAMRQVLVDYARSRNARKRVSPDRVPELLHPAQQDHESSLAVKCVFEKLKRFDPRVAETVWLRCVEDATIGEVSALQTIEAWRVRENYDFGLEWMAEELSRGRR